MKPLYPNYTRKAMTFTLDDGNIKFDRKLLEIIKPKGFIGTFNICSHSILNHGLNAEELREFYRGYELTNHCKYHPRLLKEEHAEMRAAATEFEPGVFRCLNEKGQRVIYATEEGYKRLVDECKVELEAIFGEGSINAFVWPYRDQESDELDAFFKARGYTSVRRTGSAPDFKLPADRMDWAYNATHKSLLTKAKAYEELADDGELTYFCFGVHAHDFEYDDCWDVLVEFAEKYGNRPSEFWYATVGEVFAYEDAIKALVETDEAIINPSAITVYVEHNGIGKPIAPGSEIKKCDFV